MEGKLFSNDLSVSAGEFRPSLVGGVSFLPHPQTLKKTPQMNTFPRISTVGALTAASVLFFNPAAKADIVANFTGGDGVESVDQYQGIPGDGWTTAWQTNTAASSAGTSLVGFVDESAPMNGGGKYLSSFLTGGSGVSKGVQQRQYGSFDNVDILAAHTVSFDLRLDSDTSKLTAGTDYFQAFDRPFTSDFGANGAWLIRASGASVNGIPALNWMFYNGGKDGGAFNTANFVDSGISFISGLVYHFVIDIDPLNLEYTVSINGGPESAPMGFRTNTPTNLGSLNFGGQVSDAGEVLAYSLDTVDVAPVAVPEPSTVALVISAGLAGVGVMRRKR
jgi:hypothetical protein